MESDEEDISYAWTFEGEDDNLQHSIIDVDGEVDINEYHRKLGVLPETLNAICSIRSKAGGRATGIIHRLPRRSSVQSAKRARNTMFRIIVPWHMRQKQQGPPRCSAPRDRDASYIELGTNRDLTAVAYNESADIVTMEIVDERFLHNHPDNSVLEGWPFPLDERITGEVEQLLKESGKLVMLGFVHGMTFEYDFWVHPPAKLLEQRMQSMLDQHKNLLTEKIPSRRSKLSITSGKISKIAIASEGVIEVLSDACSSSGASGALAGISFSSERLKSYMPELVQPASQTMVWCLRLWGSVAPGTNKFIGCCPNVLNDMMFPCDADVQLKWEDLGSPKKEQGQKRIAEAGLAWQANDSHGIPWRTSQEELYQGFRRFAQEHTYPRWSITESEMPDNMLDANTHSTGAHEFEPELFS